MHCDNLKTLAVLEHENQQYYEIHVQLKNPMIHCTLVLKQESRHGYPRVLDLPAMRFLSDDICLTENTISSSWN